MFDNIIIGKYYYGKSVVHNWNSFSKLLCSLCFIISVFAIDQISVLLFYIVVLILLLLLSDISCKYYAKVVWSTRYFLIFLFLFHLIFGTNVVESILLIIKIILILLYSAMVLYTTSIQKLTDSFTLLFYPLTFLRIPITFISRIIGLSISFLPIVLQQTQRILKSLTVKGIDYKNSTIQQKLNIWKLLITPLLMNAFHYADNVAFTMETRLYYIGEKQKISIERFYFFDIFQIIFHLLMLILVWKEGII